MRGRWIGLMAPLALAGCGQTDRGTAGGYTAGTMPTTTVAVTTPTDHATTTLPGPAGGSITAALPTDAWLGKWVGVEGLVLVVARGDMPGNYRLHVMLMDGARDYIGTAAGDTIRFERDGVAETIRATTGAETGLKWLADKRNCLTIRAGEGFCRS